jgi:hypothetical protein
MAVKSLAGKNSNIFLLGKAQTLLKDPLKLEIVWVKINLGIS